MSARLVALVTVGAISTLTIKAVGPILLGGRPLSDRVRRVLELMASSLLAALIAIQALTRGSTIVLDERLAGVTVAGLALALRANIFFVVLLAALTTALLRAKPRPYRLRRTVVSSSRCGRKEIPVHPVLG